MKKGNNLLNIVFVSSLIALTTMLVGILWIYFVKVTENKDSNKVNVKTINLMVVYDNGNQIRFADFKNDTEKNISISIINSDEDAAKYQLSLKVNPELTNEKASGLVYTLVSSATDNAILTNINSESVPTKDTIIDTISIKGKSTHKYILSVKVKDDSLFDKDIITFGLSIKKGIN